jgi:hypothetical protein
MLLLGQEREIRETFSHGDPCEKVSRLIYVCIDDILIECIFFRIIGRKAGFLLPIMIVIRSPVPFL